MAKETMKDRILINSDIEPKPKKLPKKPSKKKDKQNPKEK
jgi:hypothetical protein